MAQFGRLILRPLIAAALGSLIALPAVAQDMSQAALLEHQVEEQLADLEASEEALAVVRFPFELARQIASGERELEARAFADRLARSLQVLDALERGNDIVHRGLGDQDRAYRFEETGELIPYRIYVPIDWDGEESLPIVVVLHGGGGDENSMMETDDGKLGKLAERYDYIVVSPLGYRVGGAYGSPIRLPSVYGATTQEGRALGGPERALLLNRSERDVLNVLERTIQEYGADRSRVYLTGHSMGGGGTWYLAHQYPELWDAIAPSAGPFFIDDFDFERLRPLPIMMIQSNGDLLSLDADRQLAIDLLTRGFEVSYVETPAVSHSRTFGPNMPTIFEFFERQRLRDDPALVIELN